MKFVTKFYDLNSFTSCERERDRALGVMMIGACTADDEVESDTDIDIDVGMWVQ